MNFISNHCKAYPLQMFQGPLDKLLLASSNYKQSVVWKPINTNFVIPKSVIIPWRDIWDFQCINNILNYNASIFSIQFISTFSFCICNLCRSAAFSFTCIFLFFVSLLLTSSNVALCWCPFQCPDKYSSSDYWYLAVLLSSFTRNLMTTISFRSMVLFSQSEKENIILVRVRLHL